MNPEIKIFTMTGPAGVEARITNYGGIVISLRTPDRTGRLADVVLGWMTWPAILRGTHSSAPWPAATPTASRAESSP